MTTIVLGDKPRLAPGQTCGHCNLRAPQHRLCPMCRRPMEDWPQDEELFLAQAGWERAPPHYWYEPVERTLGEVTAAMLNKAEVQLTQAEQFIEARHVIKDAMKMEDAERGLANARAALTLLQEASATGTRIPIRKREMFPQEEAVRQELVKDRKYPDIIKEEKRVFSDDQVKQAEEFFLTSHGQLNQRDKLYLKRMANKTVESNSDVCPSCRRR